MLGPTPSTMPGSMDEEEGCRAPGRFGLSRDNLQLRQWPPLVRLLEPIVTLARS